MFQYITSLICMLLHRGAASTCARDGSDYSYTESVSGQTRTIVYNGCPNHPWYKLNPNFPFKEITTVTVPAYPKFEGSTTATGVASGSADLTAKGGAIGVFFNGAQVFSPFGGPNYGAATSYQTSATYAEGNTFDHCGCHGSTQDSASYHCHVPPSCLLKQLGQSYNPGTDAGGHSPQIGWAGDGFPIYGPHGPQGVMMKSCSVTGGTYGTDTCTDDCGGYYSNDGSIDNYAYRYYTQGTYSDGTSCSSPSCPSSGEEYFPHTPACFRGCCPSGASCESWIPACSGSAADGYVVGFTPAVPVINNLDLSSGLALNAEACACSSTMYAVCTDQHWKTTKYVAETQTTCPVAPTPAAATSNSNPTPAPATGNSNPTPAPAQDPTTTLAQATASSARSFRCQVWYIAGTFVVIAMMMRLL